ncbi:MAG: hypothetical protein Unbinned400contig1000_37 [Prokaryotic dsDNA virus sp.]|nr:MAG: hypothetical protein Unbinned400contig1000_37 [Prokaryotic dsDNA virus sp.]
MKIELRCQTCDNTVRELGSETYYDVDCQQIHLLVEPCPQCLSDAYDEGWDACQKETQQNAGTTQNPNTGTPEQTNETRISD